MTEREIILNPRKLRIRKNLPLVNPNKINHFPPIRIYGNIRIFQEGPDIEVGSTPSIIRGILSLRRKHQRDKTYNSFYHSRK